MRDQFASSRLAGLCHELCHMRLDGLRRDEQPLGDLGVGASAGHEQVDVHLAAGDAQPP
jgi:hypothetical protein